VDPYLQAAAEIQTKPPREAAEILLAMARRHERKATIIPADSNLLATARRGDQHRTIIDDRIIILCRMLFTAKPGGNFRRPVSAFCVFLGGARHADWPLAPIELIDGVPFLVARESGGVAGQARESAESYLHYCLENCDWNPIRYEAKTAPEKEAALAKLLASPKWVWQVSLNPGDEQFLSGQIKPAGPRE
jgi:hypothetical protein